MRANKAILIKLFSLSAIFIMVAITAFLLNTPKAQAKEPKPNMGCHWVDAAHIICIDHDDALGGAVDLVSELSNVSNCSGIKPGVNCIDYWFDAEKSLETGHVYFNGNSYNEDLYFSTDDPSTAYFIGNDQKDSNGLPTINASDATPNVTLTRISNATKPSPESKRCSILNTGPCDDQDDDGVGGLSTTGLDTTEFNEKAQELAELEELSNQCEKQVPLGFIFCPIYKLTTDAITSLIGGSSTSGNRQGLLITFLSVSPLKSEDGSQNVMQVFVGQVVNLANLVYIVVFLLLIFSSSLPLGLDNYTIKKMLPKFIAAVILTQFSYVITQLVIDFFNIMGVIVPNIIFSLGVGTQQIIEATGGVQGGDYSGINQIGTGMGLVFIVGTAGTGPLLIAAFGFILLLILAFIALIALIVAFVYMVLRYLVIYILVIISPFAFVAWVLPGTEKFFFSWWKNFIRVNAVFPMITGMLAIAVVLSQVIVAGANNNNENGAVGTATQLMAMIIPIVALFMVPKTLKWTTQGMNALAAGALGFAAGKMGGGAKAVGAGAKATGKYAKSAGKDAANDYRTKKAGEMFGRGNKAGGALLMGKLPTSKGTHQAREAAAKAEREVAERNQASLASEGNNLQGLAGVDLRDRDAIENRLLQRGVRADRAAAQAALIHSRAASAGVTTGAELYNKELSQVALGRGSQILGVSAGDTGMQTAAITELGKLGDYQAIYDVQQEVVKDATGNPVLDASGNTQPVVSQSTIMKGIEPHIGDVMTKAPDLVKGGNGAFDNIGAEKIAALDKDSAKRMVAHVSNGANFRDPTTGAIDPTKHAAAVKNLHDEATRMAGDPRIVAGMDPRARAELNRFLQATGHAGI